MTAPFPLTIAMALVAATLSARCSTTSDMTDDTAAAEGAPHHILTGSSIVQAVRPCSTCPTVDVGVNIEQPSTGETWSYSSGVSVTHGAIGNANTTGSWFFTHAIELSQAPARPPCLTNLTVDAEALDSPPNGATLGMVAGTVIAVEFADHCGGGNLTIERR